MPRLPVDTLDVLVVDRMGKGISGVGSSNITGRIGVSGERNAAAACRHHDGLRFDGADARNAIGVGLVRDHAAPVRRDRYEATYERHHEQLSGPRQIPVVADGSRGVRPLRSCGRARRTRRIVRILDTLHLEEVKYRPFSTDLESGRIGLGRADLFDGAGRLTAF